MRFSKTLALMGLGMSILLTGCGNNDTEVVAGNENAGGNLELAFHYHVEDSTVFNEEWPVWQQIGDHTGVSLINTANPVAQNSTEQFNLQAADGFPADIYGGRGLANQFNQFGMQGAFIPLNDLIAEYAPNIQAMLDENPVIKNAITAPDGNIYYIPSIPDGFEGRSYFIRQDWLDILGLDRPTTVEELEDALVAFRDEMPAITGNDVIAPYFDDDWRNMIRLTNLWGARAYGNEDGPFTERIVPSEDSDELYHAWLADEFRVGIENLSRWYDEGLIDRAIFTRGSASRQELLTQNMGGMTNHFPVSTAEFNLQLADEIDGFNFISLAPVEGTDGRQVNEHERLPVTTDGWAISHANEHPEETIKYFEFFFTDLGRTLLVYGAEGISFEFDENGDRVILDSVFEQGMPMTTYLRNELGALAFIGYKQDAEHSRKVATPEALDAFDMLATEDYRVAQLPPLSFNEEEQAVIDRVLMNLNAYLDEQIQSMILGDWEDVAGQWDNFVAGAERLGASELVAAYQTAYDRYLEVTKE